MDGDDNIRSTLVNGYIDCVKLDRFSLGDIELRVMAELFDKAVFVYEERIQENGLHILSFQHQFNSANVTESNSVHLYLHGDPEANIKHWMCIHCTRTHTETCCHANTADCHANTGVITLVAQEQMVSL
jgi:hypothetical protein